MGDLILVMFYVIAIWKAELFRWWPTVQEEG